MTASGTGSLIFIDDVTDNLHKHFDSLQRSASKLIGRKFIMQQNNDPKHTTNMTKDFIRGRKWNVLNCPSQSHDLNSLVHSFHLLKKRLKGETNKN